MTHTLPDSIFKNPVIYLLFFTLLTCYACAAGKNLNQPYTCDFMEEKVKPAWIEGRRSTPGYYVGVGQAGKHEDGVDAQLLTAKKNAMADLAETIQVQVKSDVRVVSTLHQIGSKETISKAVRSDIKTRTDIELSGTVQDSSWLDEDNCMYWVRLTVRRKLVDNLILLNQAKTLYQIALDQDRVLSIRLQKINHSIQTLKKVDFSTLPSLYGDQDIFLTQYQTLQNDLRSRTQGRKIIYIVNGSDNLSMSFLDSLADRFMSRHSQPAWYEKEADCTTDKACLNKARNSRGKWLVLIHANTRSFVADMGMWEGELEIQAALYDVKKGRLVSGKVTGKDKTFSFEKHGLLWEGVLDKIMEQNVFDPFFQTLNQHLN